jgi:hypothetical protein
VNPANEDRELLARAAAWGGEAGDYAAFSREHGLDFATAVLYSHIARHEDNARFLASAALGAKPAVNRIAIVPGAFHREYKSTGADGARFAAIVRSMGLEADVIPAAAFGRTAENARIILDWLASQTEPVALVSLSKGTTDVRRALALPDAAAAFANVPAWLSFSGLFHGTPLIEWLRRQPLRHFAVRALLWWKGHPRATLGDLRHAPAPVAVPPHLHIVHVCAFPLRRHLAHEWAPRAYGRLAPLGPNDGGGILLSDALRFPGIVCPIWAADHYLAPRWDITPSLTGIIAAALAPRHASQSATAPSSSPASRSSA